MAITTPHFDLPFRLSGGPGFYTAYRDLILADNPEAYWRFESANATADEVGRHPLTFTGTTAPVPGLIRDGGQARDFSGGGHADSGALSVQYQTKGFSMETWIRTPAATVPGTQIPFCCLNTTTYIAVTPSGSTVWAGVSGFFSSGIGQVTAWAGPIVNPNTAPHHLVLVWDTKTLAIWIDGVLGNSVAAVATNIDTGTGFRLGDYGGPAYPFPGVMDEPIVYTYPLTQQQITARYLSGIKGLYRSGAAIQEQDTFDDIANCVECVVRTPYGFRQDNLAFGMPEFELLTQPVMSDVINDVVSQQEPRAEILMSENRSLWDQFITNVVLSMKQNPES